MFITNKKKIKRNWKKKKKTPSHYTLYTTKTTPWSIKNKTPIPHHIKQKLKNKKLLPQTNCNFLEKTSPFIYFSLPFPNVAECIQKILIALNPSNSKPTIFLKFLFHSFILILTKCLRKTKRWKIHSFLDTLERLKSVNQLSYKFSVLYMKS